MSMMTTLDEVLNANRLLVSLGGADQMQAIAAKSIERSLNLQSRIDRALQYASETPPNSVHARQMARILDGSITVEDEIAEAEEEAARGPRHLPAPEPKRTRGKGKKTTKATTGLSGRSTAERAAIRAWIVEQEFDVAPFGRIPEKFIELYDQAQEELRKRRAQDFANAQVQREQQAQQ
jgi:hypothetical protein